MGVRAHRGQLLPSIMSTAAITELQAFLILNALPNIGPVTLNRLLAELGGDPRAVLSADRRRLEAVRGVGPVIATTLTEDESAVAVPAQSAAGGRGYTKPRSSVSIRAHPWLCPRGAGRKRRSASF